MVFSGKNQVDEVKSRLDIAEVIGRFVQLKRVGTNFRGLCPFHGEKTPSFYVTPSRQIWHCFGCGEGGDVISFIQKIEHLEFAEALGVLAEQAGVVLEKLTPKEIGLSGEKERLYKINAFTAEVYHRSLLSSGTEPAQKYLQSRGLTLEAIRKWKIGFSPADGQAVAKAIARHKISEKDLVSAGIYAVGSRGAYDRFYGRITFPILDIRGKVLGFSARIIEKKDDIAKYVNSAESLIYKKSDVLFGLFHAKDAIFKSGEVLVVEGQMDCISLHVSGFVNVVATSGTAFTDSHAKLLRRLAGAVVLCFDSDDAGQKALEKSGATCLRFGIKVKVVTLPSGKDPDELVRKDLSAWKQALKTARPLIEYHINTILQKYSQDALKSREAISKIVLPLIDLIRDPLEKEFWLGRVHETFGVSFAAQEAVISQVARDEGKVNSSDARRLEIQLLGGLLQYPEVLQMAEKIGLTAQDFQAVPISVLVDSLLKGQVFDPEDSLVKEAGFVVESLYTNFTNREALLAFLFRGLVFLRLKSITSELADLAKADTGDQVTKAQRLSTLVEQKHHLQILQNSF